MIPRIIENQILNSLEPAKVVALFGARRTGKTVLMNFVKNKLKNKKILMVQGDNLDVTEILSSQRLTILQPFVKGYEYLFIDEAQKIPNIGQSLKLLCDTVSNLNIFIAGSSVLNYAKKLVNP